MKTIGVDLGGTKLAIALVEKGQILARYEVPTAVEKGPQGVFEQIFQGIDEVMRDDVMGIGIGCPGTVRAEEGIVEFAPNLGWREVEVTGVLQERYGLEIRLDNDANAAAWGEFCYGAGRGLEDIIYITVSTGIGGGIILGGQIYRGCGQGGELGHVVLWDGGPLCSCGNKGCLEALASGTSIAKRAQERGLGGVSSKEVGLMAKEGHPVAVEILEKAFRYLGIGIANLMNILDPQLVIIGGGVSRMGQQLLEPVRRVLPEFCLRRGMVGNRVVLSQLGADVGIIGAAALVDKPGLA